MDLGLHGKIAIVGGASKGIGKATAHRLVQEGASVTIVARTKETLVQTGSELAEISSANQVLAIPANLSLVEDIDAVVQKTVDQYGRIDILVNNTGGPPIATAEEASDEQWIAAFTQNFLSVQRLTTRVLPFMRRQNSGRIITVLSHSVKEPIPNLVLSNATRMGVVGFSKTLADEIGPANITANVVGPGAILTDRYRTLTEARAAREGISVEEAIEQRAQTIPLRRIGRPEDMADLIAFLASERAGYITGTYIPVDGGWIRASL